MFGQFPVPFMCAGGVVLGFVLGVVVVDGVVFVVVVPDDVLVAAFAIAALPPTSTPVTARVRRAFLNRVCICSLTSFLSMSCSQSTLAVYEIRKTERGIR
jgi:hypothetical protein